MDPNSFKGAIFHVWKGNHPCRIYVTDRQVYFIRRVAGIDAGAAAVLGSQFGLLGGLAAGLAGAAKAKSSADFVRDDDPTPPDQLLSKHADNYAIPLADIVDPRIEPAGKYMSFGKNAGRWHFTRRGDAKETVVLLESVADTNQAVSLLGSVLGSRLRSQPGIAPQTSESDGELVTDLPVPPEQAELVTAMQGVTQLLSERAPAEWQKVRCEIRAAASDFSPRPLDIVIVASSGDRSDEGSIAVDDAIEQAAMRLARKMSASLKTFPGLAIEMTRLDQEKWHTNVKLMGKG